MKVYLILDVFHLLIIGQKYINYKHSNFWMGHNL